MSAVTVKSVAVMIVNDVIGRISAVAAHNLDYLSKFYKKKSRKKAQKYNKTYRLQILFYLPFKKLRRFRGIRGYQRSCQKKERLFLYFSLFLTVILCFRGETLILIREAESTFTVIQY